MQKHFTYSGSRELATMLDEISHRIGSRAQSLMTSSP